jgi:predicted nucleotidyltransferase
MRLTDPQIRTIKEAARRVFGTEATVLLFGSRLDDRAREDDIDLPALCDQRPEQSAWKATTMTAKIQQRIGVQKIDVLVTRPGATPNPFAPCG